MQRKRIAIVGAGVAGLSAAWLLHRDHQVTLFERNDYFGGHSHTVTVETADGPAAIDTGFVVYNEPNYPHLTGLFRLLGVKTQHTDMSFAASIDGGRIEYAGSNLGTLFAQKRNLANPLYWHMLGEILRFNRTAKASLATGDAAALSLGEYLDYYRFGSRLRDHYLLPMAAAIWSCPTATMMRFPAMSFLQFFRNHGLLDLKDRPQWQTVSGGSQQYVARLLADLGDDVHRSAAATRIERRADAVRVHTVDGEYRDFDDVVLACHADEALRMIAQPTAGERRLLGAFSYQENRTLLHSDAALMPKNQKTWSSWNYLAQTGQTRERHVSVSYWMNRLQRLPHAQQFFVSLNPLQDPRSETVLREMSYHHPVFDEAAMAAQHYLHELQGRDRLWFAGSYFGYGFHEDALRSAVEMARLFGVSIPWEGTPARGAQRPVALGKREVAWS